MSLVRLCPSIQLLEDQGIFVTMVVDVGLESAFVQFWATKIYQNGIKDPNIFRVNLLCYLICPDECCTPS